MRALALAVLLASAPAAADAQLAPRSLALELGFARDSAAALGERAPVALAATWWLAGEIDATARVAWAFAPRTGDRAAASSFEAGAGVRYGVARWPALRLQVVVELGFVHVLDAPRLDGWTSDSGVRAGLGAALEVFLARDVSLSFTGRLTDLALASGDGGAGASLATALAVYF